MNLAKFLRTPFLQNTSGRLLLNKYIRKIQKMSHKCTHKKRKRTNQQDETRNGKNPTKIFVSGAIEQAGLGPGSDVIHAQRGIYILLISTTRWYFK